MKSTNPDNASVVRVGLTREELIQVLIEAPIDPEETLAWVSYSTTGCSKVEMSWCNQFSKHEFNDKG